MYLTKVKFLGACLCAAFLSGCGPEPKAPQSLENQTNYEEELQFEDAASSNYYYRPNYKLYCIDYPAHPTCGDRGSLQLKLSNSWYPQGYSILYK